MKQVNFNLNKRDGSLIKTIIVEDIWYVPPKLVIHQGDYYLRVSPDNIHDPVEFNQLGGIEIWRDP